MTDQAPSFVRHDFIQPEKPPISDATAFGWLRRNLFATPPMRC